MVTKVILERDLEKYFTAQCKKHKLLSLKLHVKFARGWPDPYCADREWPSLVGRTKAARRKTICIASQEPY